MMIWKDDLERLTSTTQLRPPRLLRHKLRNRRLHAKSDWWRRTSLLWNQRSHRTQHASSLLGWQLRWSLTESTVHDTCRLRVLERRLLLLETSLLG